VTKKRGRGDKFTNESRAAMFKTICNRISNGNSLKRICDKKLCGDDTPDISTVWDWIHRSQENTDNYAKACEERTDSRIDEMHYVEDEAAQECRTIDDPKRAAALMMAYRMKVDNIKWYASKMKPKKYGNSVDVTSGGEKISSVPTFVVVNDAASAINKIKADL
jgi:hypothetical protein